MQENSIYGKVYILGRLNDGSFIFFNYDSNIDIETSFKNYAAKEYKMKEKNKRKFFHSLIEIFRKILKEEDFLYKDQIKKEE